MLTWLESREVAHRTRSASPAGPLPEPGLPPGTAPSLVWGSW